MAAVADSVGLGCRYEKEVATNCDEAIFHELTHLLDGALASLWPAVSISHHVVAYIQCWTPRNDDVKLK